MNHFASSRFWACYEQLPADVQAQADKQFTLLKANPRHPSLHFKKIGNFWSARVNASTRALAIADGNDMVWFWIGAHPEYERLLRQGR